MSRDGWLPPGVTDADIDRAAPGYDDEVTSMTDIVERLRKVAALDKFENARRMKLEAADEIERLRADNKLLVERVLELELELNRGCR